MKPVPKWWAELPVHWDVLRGDHMARRVRRPPGSSDGVVTAFRDGQVTLRSNRRLEGFTEALLELGYQGIRPGDLVIHSMDAFAGAIGVSDSAGKASPVVHAYRGTRGDPRYLAYALRTAARSGYIQSLAKGIRERSTAFDAPMFKDMLLPAPPLLEQVAIADFLDRETAKIDALIETQTAFIVTVEERMQRRIVTAVTVGLAIGQATRPSDVPWLPEIPREWSVTRIGYHFEVQLGKMLDAGKQTGDLEEIRPYLRAANIQPHSLDLDDLKQMPFTAGELSRLSLRKNDLLVVEGGATVGRSWRLAADLPDIAFQKTLNRVRSRGSSSTHFLDYVLKWLRQTGAIDLVCDGSTFAHLTAEKLRALRIPFPPPDEQRAIAARLDVALKESTMLVETAERLISLARERRAALITAAVTGQMGISSGKVA